MRPGMLSRSPWRCYASWLFTLRLNPWPGCFLTYGFWMSWIMVFPVVLEAAMGLDTVRTACSGNLPLRHELLLFKSQPFAWVFDTHIIYDMYPPCSSLPVEKRLYYFWQLVVWSVESENRNFFVRLRTSVIMIWTIPPFVSWSPIGSIGECIGDITVEARRRHVLLQMGKPGLCSRKAVCNVDQPLSVPFIF